jgi:hypothetical protein
MSIDEDDYARYITGTRKRERSPREEHEEDAANPSDTYYAGARPMRPQPGRSQARVIPYRVKVAARVIADAREASRTAQIECEGLARLPDEYTRVDPYVVLVDTIPLGALRVHMKEAVPLSTLLAARLLRCKYGIPGAAARDYASARLKPYHETGLDHAQPFYCDESIDDEHFDRTRVLAYVQALGPISSEVAASHVFVDEHLERLASLE